MSMAGGAGGIRGFMSPEGTWALVPVRRETPGSFTQAWDMAKFMYRDCSGCHVFRRAEPGHQCGDGSRDGSRSCRNSGRAGGAQRRHRLGAGRCMHMGPLWSWVSLHSLCLGQL